MTLLLLFRPSEAVPEVTAAVTGGKTIQYVKPIKYPKDYKLEIPVFGRINWPETVTLHLKISNDEQINTTSRVETKSKTQLNSRISTIRQFTGNSKTAINKQCNLFLNCLTGHGMMFRKLERLEKINRIRKIYDVLDDLFR